MGSYARNQAPWLALALQTSYFLAAFLVLINKFDDACTKAKLTTTLDASSAADFFGVASCLAQVTSNSTAYMDDLNKLIFLPTWTNYFECPKSDMYFTQNFSFPWVYPQFQEGKTEAIIFFNGVGSKEVRRQIKLENDSIIQ